MRTPEEIANALRTAIGNDPEEDIVMIGRALGTALDARFMTVDEQQKGRLLAYLLNSMTGTYKLHTVIDGVLNFLISRTAAVAQDSETSDVCEAFLLEQLKHGFKVCREARPMIMKEAERLGLNLKLKQEQEGRS
jgi:hypothetical protein